MNFELILKFLKDIGKNNDRDWFEKNKPKYLAAKDSFDEFVAPLLDELIKFELSNGQSKKMNQILGLVKNHFSDKTDEFVKSTVNSMINQGILTDYEGNISIL